jgi:putative transposase
MVLYRRNHVPGATYFFTVALRDRTTRLLTGHVSELRRAYAEVWSRRPFETVALAVLPDHLHAIWRLPEGDADYSGRWRAIKAAFVINLRRSGVAVAENARREAGVWQRRFWEHTIRDEADLRAHVDYVHWNPLKHGHVARVVDWPYSSLHRYVREGVLASDWGGTSASTRQDRSFGE